MGPIDPRYRKNASGIYLKKILKYSFDDRNEKNFPWKHFCFCWYFTKPLFRQHIYIKRRRKQKKMFEYIR